MFWLRPVPVEAQFGIPQIVFDPAAVGKLLLQARQQVTQIQQAVQQVTLAKAEAERITGFRLGNFDGFLAKFDQTVGSATRLGYRAQELNSSFEQTFPEVASWAGGMFLGDYQSKMVRDAARAALLGTQDQGRQLDAARQQLAQVKNQAAGAVSATQVAQSQAALSGFALDEAQQARQLQIAANNQRAVMDAYQVSRLAREDSAIALSKRKDYDQTRLIMEAWRVSQEALAARNPGVFEGIPIGGSMPRAVPVYRDFPVGPPQTIPVTPGYPGNENPYAPAPVEIGPVPVPDVPVTVPADTFFDRKTDCVRSGTEVVCAPM